MPFGDFRRVFLVGKVAIKIPRSRFVLLGLRCNRWEREMWQKWRRIFEWEFLCPIRFADPLGLVVVMPRATQPVTVMEIDEAWLNCYPDVLCEGKPDDWGLVDGQVVCLDYGLPDACMVRERRSYYRSKVM